MKAHDSFILLSPGRIFCLLLRVSSDYAQPITVQVTEVTCPEIGQAQSELTPSKGQKRAQVLLGPNMMMSRLQASIYTRL